jgi:hypothetical protein
MPGAIWSLWASARPPIARRLGREKSSKGTTPTAQGPSGQMGSPRSIGSRWVSCPMGGQPCPVEPKRTKGP